MVSSPLRFRPKRPPQPPPPLCLNCGAEVKSRFCPDCGQEVLPLRLSVMDIFRDAFEEFFKFDSKLFVTLKPLFFRPGFLTREWAAGRRIRYITPFRLYLTATFLFFLCAAWKIDHKEDLKQSAGPRGFTISSPDRSKEEDKIFFVRTMRKLEHATERDVVGGIIENMPKVLFVLLPLFAFFLKLFYIRSRRYYVEHLVFALHNHAFYFLIFSVVTWLPGQIPDLVASLWCVGYTYFAIKRNYGQGWLKTLFKGTTLGCGYSILLALAAFGALFLSAMAMADKKPEDEEKKPAKSGAAPDKKEPAKRDSASVGFKL